MESEICYSFSEAFKFEELYRYRIKVASSYEDSDVQNITKEIGLRYLRTDGTRYVFKIIDEPLYMLAKIKYGI